MYYGFENLCSSDDISHHGILGQKWGVRRYQNPDGTLTDAGKKRYYKYFNGLVLTKKGEKMYKKNELFRTSHDKRVAENNKRASEIVKKMNAITAQNKKIIENNVSKKDVFTYEDQRNYEKDKAVTSRMDKAAFLGLEALRRMDSDGKMEDLDFYSSTDKSNRKWFLFEDQTIGMPSVANMIANGKTAKQVETIIKTAEKISGDEYPDTKEYEHYQTIIFDAYNGNYNNKLVDFAKECEKVNNSQKFWSDYPNQKLRFEMQSDPEKTKAFIEKLVRKEISDGGLSKDEFDEAVDYYYSNGRLHDHVVYEYSNKR